MVTGLDPLPDWPRYLGMPTASGVIRSHLEDFYVEEISRIQPLGEGSHRWLWVEKTGANTDWVAGQLARSAKCARRDVGYAGLKDRHAVTRQWFSVPESHSLEAALEHLDIEGVSILASSRHTRKLKRGTLNGNRFSLRIRQFEDRGKQVERRLEQVCQKGVPNYFGPQRFGHRGLNVQKAFESLGKQARLSRNRKGIYLSALRSFLFNQVLAIRVQRENWNIIINGDLVMLDGSHSIFSCEIVDRDIEERCMRLDIHPTGPLPGIDGAGPQKDAGSLEYQVLDEWAAMTDLLVGQGVKASRRALRLYPAELRWSVQGSELEISFVLPPGTYATVVLREILTFDTVGY